ncbi:acyl carrier protein [Nitrobacter sp.]|jgi:acyl carrier protein|uniref:acyl carrier protein n=1 Tax=Nitrobacter sp. TaxID=29420 RepID=UPI0029CAC3BE|nr:phosphopantetheine-binding protein [Nitrobacter sp.]
MPNAAMFNEVKDVVAVALGIQDRASDFEPSTPLLGSIPELDSMAVLEVVLAIEQHFNFAIDDSEMTGEIFETFGSLADFVAQRQR